MFTRLAVSAGTVLTSMLALSGAAILGGGAASADSSQDDQFLALLNQKGVSALSGVPSLIATAHEICGNLDAGVSANALVDALVDNANNVTPGAERGRLVRTEGRFLAAAVEAYCPNNLGRIGSVPAGWNNATHRVVLASRIKETNPDNPSPPVPGGPDIQILTPPQAAAPPPARKVAPPVVGPPPGGGGGGGGTGGGTGGAAPLPPVEPGIIALAP